jgi:hypothetical protein
MAKMLVTTAAAFAGLVVGAIIGVLGAPAWEMAGLFVGFFASVAGALAAACLASMGMRLVPALLAVFVPAGSLAMLSQGNPLWVTMRCTLLVAAAGVAGCLIGYLLGMLTPSPPQTNGL